MSQSVEDIISKLEYRILEPPSIKISVQTQQGEIVRLNRDLWDESPVLKKHFAEGDSHLVLDVTQDCLFDFLEIYEDDSPSDDLAKVMNYLAVCSLLELEDLVHDCLYDLVERRELTELEIPYDCSVETVMQCFRVLLKTPLRTAGIYERQLQRMAYHCDHNSETMMNAINLVKHELRGYAALDLEGIPADFDELTAFIVIHKRFGHLESAVVVDNRKLVPVNLQEDGDPTEIHKNVISLEVDGRLVIAHRREGKRDSLMLWVDDEEFIQIHESGCPLEVDIGSSNDYAAIIEKTGNTERCFELKDTELILVEHEDIQRMRDRMLARREMLRVLDEQSSGLSSASKLDKLWTSVCYVLSYILPSPPPIDEAPLEEDFGGEERLYLDPKNRAALVVTDLPSFAVKRLYLDPKNRAALVVTDLPSFAVKRTVLTSEKYCVGFKLSMQG